MKLPAKNYKKSYLDPRWQRKRLEIMKRDDFCCLACGESSKTLNVHHTYYVSGRDIWDYPNFCYKTYCSDCHKCHHEIMADSENKSLEEFEFIVDHLDSINLDIFCSVAANIMAIREKTQLDGNQVAILLFDYTNKILDENKNQPSNKVAGGNHE